MHPVHVSRILSGGRSTLSQEMSWQEVPQGKDYRGKKRKWVGVGEDAGKKPKYQAEDPNRKNPRQRKTGTATGKKTPTSNQTQPGPQTPQNSSGKMLKATAGLQRDVEAAPLERKVRVAVARDILFDASMARRRVRAAGGRGELAPEKREQIVRVLGNLKADELREVAGVLMLSSDVKKLSRNTVAAAEQVVDAVLAGKGVKDQSGGDPTVEPPRRPDPTRVARIQERLHKDAETVSAFIGSLAEVKTPEQRAEATRRLTLQAWIADAIIRANGWEPQLRISSPEHRARVVVDMLTGGLSALESRRKR